MVETFLCDGGCGRELKMFKRRKTKFCRSCIGVVNGRDPARIEKSRAGMKRRMQDPAFKAEHIRRTSDGLRARLANDPEEMERRREVGRALFRTGLGHAAQGPGSEPRRRVARMQVERALGWCPEHLRDQYRTMVNSKGIKAAEARRIIEAEMDRERAQRGRRLSFEDQLRRVQAGARVVRKFEPRAADHDFTLGGVATGMI